MSNQSLLRGQSASIAIEFKALPRARIDPQSLVEMQVSLVCEGVSAADYYPIETKNLTAFVKNLIEKQESLTSGEIALCSYDHCFTLILKYDSIGNVEIQGNLRHSGSTYVTVDFKFFSDQTYVRTFLEELLVYLNM